MQHHKQLSPNVQRGSPRINDLLMDILSLAVAKLLKLPTPRAVCKGKKDPSITLTK